MEKNQTQKKSKNQRKKLFLTRCIVFILLFIMALPMLCSMTFPATITLKAGTYRFNDVINFSTISLDTGYAYHIDLDFRLPTVTAEISQSLADEVNSALASVGFSETFTAGTYIINRSYSEIFLLEAMNTSGVHYIMTYNGGNTEVLPDTNVIQYLWGVDDEAYNSYYDVPWNNFLDYAFYQTIILDTDQVVDYDFGMLFMSNTDYYEVNSSTTSFTNLWTGIMNWITSALSSVQGLFYNDGSIDSILNFDNSIEVNGTMLYQSTDNSLRDVYYNGVFINELDESQLIPITIEIDGQAYDVFTYTDNASLIAINNNGVIFLNPLLTTSSTGALTFLGTLAVIGVSISIAFVLILVIRRFLALRS